MKRRTFLAGLAAVAAGPALAQDALPRVALETPAGVIVIELETVKAPITAANFLRYVDQKRFDGGVFYRASKNPGAAEFGMIQGGVNNDPARQLKPIRHEPTTLTGLTHTDGVISMGRFAPGTAQSEFFICVGDQTFLDADPAAKGDNLGFAAFGRVVEGMDVVKTILAAPVSPTAGTGAMKGEMLAPKIRILTARRVP